MRKVMGLETALAWGLAAMSTLQRANMSTNEPLDSVDYETIAEDLEAVATYCKAKALEMDRDYLDRASS